MPVRTGFGETGSPLASTVGSSVSASGGFGGSGAGAAVEGNCAGFWHDTTRTNPKTLHHDKKEKEKKIKIFGNTVWAIYVGQSASLFFSSSTTRAIKKKVLTHPRPPLDIPATRIHISRRKGEPRQHQERGQNFRNHSGQQKGRTRDFHCKGLRASRPFKSPSTVTATTALRVDGWCAQRNSEP